MAQGRLDTGAGRDGEDLAITKRLAEADPRNSQWQRDLSISYAMLGDGGVGQGKLETGAGLIRFGSRVDIYMPLDATVTCAVGDKVVAGKSKLAKLNNTHE